MKAMGRLPETTILEFCEMEADKTLSMQMGIRLGEKVLKLKRLRMADGIPMMVERSYLPARLFISLTALPSHTRNVQELFRPLM